MQNFQRLNDRNLTVCCIRGIRSDKQEEIIGQSANGSAITNLFLPFCDDMSSLLSETDLLICRAGAGTIAEAILFGLPTILVPDPNAAENHQEVKAIWGQKVRARPVFCQFEIKSVPFVISYESTSPHS
jgi:UDP-N-acetylglucosamine:LPS N-acetylglucosamine transferase